MSPESAVDSLLREGIDDGWAREAVAFDEAVDGARGLVRFGAGGLGRKLAASLRSAGIEPLLFADRNRALGKVDRRPRELVDLVDHAVRP